MKFRSFLGESLPFAKAFTRIMVAGGQHGVARGYAGKAIRVRRDQTQADQAAPVLAEQRDVLELQLVQHGLHPVDVPLVGVILT